MLRNVMCMTLMACCFTGCGPAAPKTVPASGILLMDDKPLEGASVNLHSEDGIVAAGTTDASGKFKLKTTIGTYVYDGAKVGKHKVAIAKTLSDAKKDEDDPDSDPKKKALMMGGMMAGMAKQTFIVPQRYNSPQNSRLDCTIPEGGTDKLEFKISSK